MAETEKLEPREEIAGIICEGGPPTKFDSAARWESWEHALFKADEILALGYRRPTSSSEVERNQEHSSVVPSAAPSVTSPSAEPNCDLEEDHVLDGEICGFVRDAAKRITGGNCAFVDDDVKLLEALAYAAVMAGLTGGLHPAVARKAVAACAAHPFALEPIGSTSASVGEGNVAEGEVMPTEPKSSPAHLLQKEG